MSNTSARSVDHLFVVRHGEYDGMTGDLTTEGEDSVASIASKIKDIVDSGSVRILSSTVKRAEDSARIMVRVLECRWTRHPDLVSWGDTDVPTTMPQVAELIRGFDPRASAVVLVTHLEFGEHFSTYYGKHELGGVVFDPRFIEKGEAWYIDCRAKTRTLLKP